MATKGRESISAKLNSGSVRLQMITIKNSNK